ncbi:hypothetical protein [Flavivirga sp. 57AJ16]|uniref:hypothetical protein n=1 Tax=Flavivirga sp. 57AJ16 TaxID=3025307 RepID=UPI002365232C|nr:hypothetical protein [Flavivirga sp. 57AJ16]MDD7884634.1 hypothetical protein [Flavivirga sp. 57AJ16]
MKFPVINEQQVALLIAEKATGVVLNTNLDTYREDIDNGPVYKIFENLTKAQGYIKNLKSNNPDIEFVLYDNEQSVIEYIYEDEK